MPYLRLRILTSAELQEFHSDPVRVGRDPNFELIPSGPGSEVVSARHAQFTYVDDQWWLVDLGSSNGTYLDDRRLEPNLRHPVRRGNLIRLGNAGPRFRIDAAASSAVSATQIEPSRFNLAGGPPTDPDATAPMHRFVVEDEDPRVPTPRGMTLILRDAEGGAPYSATGDRIRLGRGTECEIQPQGDSGSVVSRVHAEVTLTPDNEAILRDAKSRNGTFVNGERLVGDHYLKVGDRIELGHGGPDLLVDLLTLPRRSVRTSAPTALDGVSAAQSAVPASQPRRSFGGQGRTMFVRQVIQETARKSSARLRWVVWGSVVVLSGAVGGVYWYAETRVRETTTALERTTSVLEAQQALNDSLQAEAQADRERLRRELSDARATSAPATVVDSLRAALAAADNRTSALEDALERARGELTVQLAAADSVRDERAQEVERIRAQLREAAATRVSPDLADSLRRALQEAERRAAELDRQMRVVRGGNLAAVAQANQGAVGLVSAFAGSEVLSGSGFVIRPSGYFVTNRHVVMPEGRHADSLFVTMADQRQRQRARVVRIQEPPGPDLAVIRIDGYRGPHVPRIDWSGTRASQGEPAALIGFPAGYAAALDTSLTVRTSMSAGIFSKVSAEAVQFDGFTVPGSSGSPIFNAAGEVVAVHRAGLRDAVGLSFAVPIGQALTLLPPDVVAEFGLPGR